jgi:hypothetical protein
MAYMTALKQHNIKGNTICLDHFKDSTRATLSTIPLLLEHQCFQPSQIYTANIGVVGNKFVSTADSADIVQLAQQLGVNAAEMDIHSLMAMFGRDFSSAYFDFTQSFATTKDTLKTFVGNHVDIKRDCIIAFTVEMNRTMHREEKSSNNEIIRDFLFGELKQVLPFTFRDPIILENDGDATNVMQFVIFKLTPAVFPHHSHMVFNPRDKSPSQIVYRLSQGGEYQRGVISGMGKAKFDVDWSCSNFREEYTFGDNINNPFTQHSLVTCLPPNTKIAMEQPVEKHPLLHQMVVKTFHDVSYEGIVDKAFKEEGKGVELFHILYSDGDEEEMTEAEVLQHLFTPKSTPTATSTTKRFQRHKSSRKIIAKLSKKGRKK